LSKVHTQFLLKANHSEFSRVGSELTQPYQKTGCIIFTLRRTLLINRKSQAFIRIKNLFHLANGYLFQLVRKIPIK